MLIVNFILYLIKKFKYIGPTRAITLYIILYDANMHRNSCTV